MSYIDGFVLPVPEGSKEAYRDIAAKASDVFRDHGAIRVLEAWHDDVPRGEVTDFYRAVKAEENEGVVFSFIEWPSKAARDEGMKKAMEDPRMAEMGPQSMPFDGKRMFWGGFEPFVDNRD